MKTIASHPLVPPPVGPPSSLSRSLSLFRSLFLSPRHLEEEIKRAGAQRQTLIPPNPRCRRPSTNLHPRRATLFQPTIRAIPLDMLAMAEGTTPSRETLPSREVLGVARAGRARAGGWLGREPRVEEGGNCFPLGLTILTVPNLRSYH